MSKAGNLVGLIILLSACCNEGKKEQMLAQTRAEEPELWYSELAPADTAGASLRYDIYGFSFFVPQALRIQQQGGVDFVVPGFMNPSGFQFYCYFGWHPGYPDPIKWQLDERFDYLGREISVKDSLVKNGFYYERILAYIEDGLKADSSINYRKDSMIFEVYRLKTKDVWIRKPLEKQSGPLDIAVIFHADSIQTKLHLFASARNSRDANYLVKLAKQIEKR